MTVNDQQRTPDNPWIPAPGVAVWSPQPQLTTLGLETFIALFHDLIPLDQPNPWAQYSMEREGTRLCFMPTAKKRAIREACSVYMGLMHAGMKLDSQRLIGLSVQVMAVYQAGQEALLASSQHANDQSLSAVEKGKALLAWYADLLEAWKLLSTTPCFAKELVTGKATRPILADYIRQDGPPEREDLLSPFVIPAIAPLPLEVLARGVNRHVRNAHDHKGGVKVLGRATVRFELSDRKWSQTMTVEEIANLTDEMESTVSALQIGALLLRLCYPGEYLQAARDFDQDERYQAQAFEMACQSHGFEAVSLDMLDDCVTASLRLMSGASSSPERPITRYMLMSSGSVRRDDRVEPAFTWSTRRQLAQVVGMVAPLLAGRRLELRIKGRDSEDLGRLTASAEMTSRLADGMMPEDLIATTEDGLVDQSPLDKRRAAANE